MTNLKSNWPGFIFVVVLLSGIFYQANANSREIGARFNYDIGLTARDYSRACIVNNQLHTQLGELKEHQCGEELRGMIDTNKYSYKRSF